MGRIATAEAERYQDVWDALELYGEHSPGAQYAEVFAEVAAPGATVLDAGCGSGKGALALRALGYQVSLCDLTDAGLQPEARDLPFRQACLWKPLRPQLRQGVVDWVYCCDVLEHLPTQFTMLAVEQLLAFATVGVFLSVSLTHDTAGAWIGDGQLHHTVQPFTWWRDSLGEVGRVQDARDLIVNGLFVVRPR